MRLRFSFVGYTTLRKDKMTKANEIHFHVFK